jgi:hypothetical protein
MAEPVPIRSGIEPEFDTERELQDYLMMKLRRFREDTGSAPNAVAIVLLGDRDDGTLATLAHSWSPDNSRSRFETCSMGSALLTQRAIKDDA